MKICQCPQVLDHNNTYIRVQKIINLQKKKRRGEKRFDRIRFCVVRQNLVVYCDKHLKLIKK